MLRHQLRDGRSSTHSAVELARRPARDDLDWLSVTYYLLLQDRIGDALAAFAHVDVDTVDARVQVDYMRAYLDFFSDDHAIARGIAEAYVDHPVERWRARFRTVLAHLDEAEGRTADPTSVDPEGADAVVAAEPTLELALRGDRVALRHSGLEACEVRYYGMDVEFLFSTSPFVKQGGGAFAYVKPGRVDRLDLPPGGEDVDFVLPAEFARENVWVEVRGGGLVRREARYSNALTVRLLETKGQLKVTHAQTGAPLQEVYVKVYAQEGDQVRFHKDGYTDLRGRFDYASVSGRQGSRPERYALLVLSRDDGAAIREVEPPVR